VRDLRSAGFLHYKKCGTIDFKSSFSQFLILTLDLKKAAEYDYCLQISLGDALV